MRRIQQPIDIKLIMPNRLTSITISQNQRHILGYLAHRSLSTVGLHST